MLPSCVASVWCPWSQKPNHPAGQSAGRPCTHTHTHTRKETADEPWTGQSGAADSRGAPGTSVRPYEPDRPGLADDRGDYCAWRRMAHRLTSRLVPIGSRCTTTAGSMWAPLGMCIGHARRLAAAATSGAEVPIGWINQRRLTTPPQHTAACFPPGAHTQLSAHGGPASVRSLERRGLVQPRPGERPCSGSSRWGKGHPYSLQFGLVASPLGGRARAASGPPARDAAGVGAGARHAQAARTVSGVL